MVGSEQNLTIMLLMLSHRIQENLLFLNQMVQNAE